MKPRSVAVLVSLLSLLVSPLLAQESFGKAAATVQQQLQDSLKELARLNKQIAGEKIPLAKELSEREAELSRVRAEHQEKVRTLDSRNLDLNNLRTEIKTRRDEAEYLQNLLAEYTRNFEPGHHIAEVKRYEKVLEAAKLALENTSLSEEEVNKAQIALLELSIERLSQALGGTRFEGTAVDSNKLVKKGRFVLVGPAAIFRSEDGKEVGTAETRLGSVEPTLVGFQNPEDTLAAAELVENGEGTFPLDPTQGNAHKIEATHETLWEHVQKGGPVMVPIFALAGIALLIALYKWLALTLVRKPSKRKLAALLEAVADEDLEGAGQRVAVMKGPVGQMLAVGVEHLGEPKELVEEAMYETVLTTKLKLQRMLPFIAICAASAPLLGLLGTVTGIINTFKMITVFGSGDVKSLSGGISEALITTKFGLIVAIPSLLLHAFLWRKARGVIGQMERAAVAFVNQVGRTEFGHVDSRPVDAQVRETLEQALETLILPAVRANLEDLIARPRRSEAEQGDGANDMPKPEEISAGSGDRPLTRQAPRRD